MAKKREDLLDETEATEGETEIAATENETEIADTPIDVESDLKDDARTCLYHKDCPEGKIFNSEKAAAAAMKNGWVDSPAKIKAEKK